MPVDVDSEVPLIDLSKGEFVPNNDSDRAPRKTRIGGKSARPATTTPKKRTPLPPWKDGVISSWAANLYTLAGQAIMAFEPNYGTILQGIAVPAGQAWENMAKESPGLRRLIHSLMTTTRMSELVVAHMPLIVLTLHKYGPIKDSFDKMAEKFVKEMEKEQEAVASDSD